MVDILIIGAGSIGVYLGVMLHKKGFNVDLVGRKKLEELNDSVKIKNKNYVLPNKLFELPKRKKYDLIFVVTKLYDYPKVIKKIKENEIKSPILVGIQNGLVDNEKYKKLFKNTEILTISVFGGYRLDGGEIFVNPTKVGWKIDDSKEGKMVCKILSKSKIKCKADSNIKNIRAEKTIVNCCLNALCAIKNKSLKNLFSNKSTKNRVDKLFYETYNILKKEYNLDNPEKLRKNMYKHWSKVDHYSSTHQDCNSGKKTEIDFFNGYVVELGKKYNLPYEENEKIIKELKLIN